MAQAPTPTFAGQLSTTRKAVKKLRNASRDADKELARLEDITRMLPELRRLQIGLDIENPTAQQGEGES